MSAMRTNVFFKTKHNFFPQCAQQSAYAECRIMLG